MTALIHRTVQLGDLIVAAFDQAACVAINPPEVTRLATETVLRLMQPQRRCLPVIEPEGMCAVA